MSAENANHLTELHTLLNQYFNLAEIRTLCLQLNLDYESLAGEEKPSQIRELLLGLARNGRLPELITKVQQERPNVAWPQMPPNFQLPASLTTGRTNAPTVAYNYYGDVVQGDKVSGDKISVGNISGSQGIAIGRGAWATVTSNQGEADAEAIAAAFARLYQAVSESLASAAQKAVAQQALEKLDQEAQKGESANEAEVQQWFHVLATMLPDIAEVAIDTFLNPIKGVSTVFRKIAAKAREQHQDS